MWQNKRWIEMVISLSKFMANALILKKQTFFEDKSTWFGMQPSTLQVQQKTNHHSSPVNILIMETLIIHDQGLAVA